MALLSVIQAVPAGAALALVAVSSSDTFVDNGDQRTYLHVNNASGGSINATVVAQKTTKNVPGAGVLSVPNIVVAVPAGAARVIGPFPDAYIAVGGTVNVTFSGTTSVTAAPVKLARASN